MEYLIAFLPLLTLIAFSFVVWLFLSKRISKQIHEHKPDQTRPPNSITLVRGIEYVNYSRKYVIIINEVEVGSISSGEAFHYELEPGLHSVRLKIDWCKTAPVNFEVTDGKNTEVFCGANYTDWKANFMAFIKPNKWLYVRVA